MHDAAVVVTTSEAGQPRLVAHLQASPGQTYTDTALRRALRATLPDRMILRAFVEHASLPRSADGSVERSRLAPAAASSASAYAPPQTPSETMLAELWRQALGVQRVGANDNFFELGGHSLLCFQVLDGIEQATGRRISPRLLLLDSLRQVAAHLDALSAAPAPAPPPAARGGVVSRLGKFLRGPA